MKNYSKALIALTGVLASAGFVACSDESPWRGSDSEGAIALEFSADGRVMRQTRADDSVSPDVPDAGLFAVDLAKSDGSFSKHWNSIDAFNAESAFPMGDYTLTASYGEPDREGFGNPYFTGSAQVHVSPGAVTETKVVATLANAMVSVRYTDEFKENFTAWSASVQSEGHDWVVFSQAEDRPAYITPSEVKLDLTLTDEFGRRVRIEPAGFTAQARHHYVVTIGVTGAAASGTLALDVQFDEDVVAETVEIPLGDELFTAPAPTVTAKGFEAGNTVNVTEGSALDADAEFHVFAFGGMKSATLTVVSANGYTPSFGRSVQLVNADAATQAKLEASGVKASGFYRNPDKMGVVNVKEFLAGLPGGEYTVSLQAVDAMTRTSEPLSLTASVQGLDVEVTPVAEAAFLASEISLDVTTNNPELRDQLKFMAPDANNRMVEVPVKSITDVTSTRSASYTYRYVLGIEPQVRAEIDVRVLFGSRTYDVKVPMEAPVYDIVADAFAGRVVLRIDAANDDLTAKIIDHLRFTNNGTQVPTATVAHEAGSKYLTITGLSAATAYGNVKALCGPHEKGVPAFTTEAETQLANGDFSALDAVVTLDPVQVGGKYKVSPVDYTTKSSITYQQPTGWATVNELTCWTGASNWNTWFVVPSTYASNGAVVLRSVGYNHSGTTPATSGGSWNTKYYCENAPSDSQLAKAAGELFLGTYAYSGSASRTDGILWATRPSTVSFDYSYVPVNGEKGELYISVLDATGASIASQTTLLEKADNMTRVNVALPAYPFGRKAARIKVAFRSTKSGVTPSVVIPSGSALKEGTSLGNKTIPANTYHALAVGSVLTVDNVTLGYGTAAARAKRK